MKKRLASLLALAALTAPSLAVAQTAVYELWLPPPTYVVQAQTAPWAPPTSPSAAMTSRFRFGVAGNFTLGLADDHGHGVDTGVFAPGITLDLGVQINRSLAVYARASGATILLMSQASVYGVVEYSPADWISLGTGLGWDGMVSNLGADSSCCISSEPTYRKRFSAVSMPAIVGFNVGRRSAVSGALRAFRVGLEGALGIEPDSGAMGWHAALSFGYVSM